MKLATFAVLVTLTLGMAATRVHAQTATQTQQGNDYNFMLGGGG